MIKARPFGVIALIMLFAIGTCAIFLSAVSLLFPGSSLLEPIWQYQPVQWTPELQITANACRRQRSRRIHDDVAN